MFVPIRAALLVTLARLPLDRPSKRPRHSYKNIKHKTRRGKGRNK